LAAVYYEAALRHLPSDADLRFEAAYAYGERDSPMQALFHYELLLRRDSQHPSGANNAGVSAGDLKLPITQMGHLREAEQLGETLAVANIAYRLIHIGMITEARAMLDEAMKAPDVHANVLHALGAIATNKDREAERLRQMRSSAERVAKYRSHAGRSATDSVGVQSFVGRFESPNGDLTITALAPSGLLRGFIKGPGIEHEFTTVSVGKALMFDWSTPAPQDSSANLLLLRPAGIGLLVLDEPHIVGYTVGKSHDIDPAQDSGFREWRFTRKEMSK
jgi:hypothetical protein